MSPDGKEVADELATDEILPDTDFKSYESLLIGRPMSAAELVRRPLLLVVVRLNICGRRALDKDDDADPSGG